MVIWTIIQKIINSKIFLYCVIGVLIWFWINDRIKLKQDINRFESNQISLIENYSRELQLTRQSFQKLFHKEDSIAKLIGIKPTQLQQVIVNNYHYKDSTINNIHYSDTTKRDTMKFIAPLGCMKLEGYTTKEGITFTAKEFNDKLHTYLYKINNKRVSFRSKDKIGFDRSFLFIKWNNHIDSKTYSECKQDTISIEKNIKIIKE